MLFTLKINTEVRTPFFSNFITSASPFYAQNNYREKTKADFSKIKLDPFCSIQNTPSSDKKNRSNFFSFIIGQPFTWAKKQVHSLIGRLILFPSSRLSLSYFTEKRERLLSQNHLNLDEWKCMRLCIDINGNKIDLMIIGKKEDFRKGRVTLYSDGQKGSYEKKLSDHNGDDLKKVLENTHSMGVLFNYPGVSASSGNPIKEEIQTTYLGLIAFLEDKIIGVQASELLLYGYSMGGAVQGGALESFTPDPSVRYVRVVQQSFSELRSIANSFCKVPFGLDILIDLLGVNIGSVSSLTGTKIPTIVLQTASLEEGETYKLLTDSSRIIHDGVIPKESALATVLLDRNITSNLTFYGVTAKHDEPIKDPGFLIDKINQLFLDAREKSRQAV